MNMTNEERASLVAEGRALAEEWFEMCGDIHEPIDRLTDQIEADGKRIVELEALTQKLMGYADHDRDCEDMTGAYPGSCTCGYSAVARAALGEAE